MRKIVIALIILINFVVVNAQKDYQSAFQFYKWKEFDNAKESIDKAVLNESSKNEPKTWYLKGVIYHNLLTSKDKNYQKLAPPNCENVILESYKKALVLDFKDTKYQTLDIQNNEEDLATFIKLLKDPNTKYIDEELYGNIMTQFSSLAMLFNTKGDKMFREEKAYDKALKTFENSLFISGLSGRVDTSIIYYAAETADSAKNYEKANSLYKKVATYNYGKNNDVKVFIWKTYAKSYLNINDSVGYLNALKLGIDKYPKNSATLLIDIINFYINSNKIQDAINYMNLAIEKAPNNPNLLYSQGTLYDKIDSTAKAISCYERAISLDSTKIDPLYNLGICYFNKGVEFLNKASDEKDDNKYKELSEKSNEYFKKSLPYFEKAKIINPKDIDVLSRLKETYYKLRINDKYIAVKKELDALIVK